MYQRKSRLSPHKQGDLIKLFVAGATARAASEIVGVNKHTAATFFLRLRQLIATKLPSYELSGEVEADESYFGGVRKGKGGRGAAGKVAVFGLLKRGGKVYTAIIPDAKNHINGIENFWNQAKRHLRRFNGIKKEHFHWFLKECEWRFNGGDHKKLLNQLKHWYKQSYH